MAHSTRVSAAGNRTSALSIVISGFVLQTSQSVHDLFLRRAVTLFTVKHSGQIALRIAALSGQPLTSNLGNVHPAHRVGDALV